MARKSFPTRGQTAAWAQALRRAALDAPPRGPHKGRKPIDRIAEKLVELALQGDLVAIRELGDRLDGKPRPAAPEAGDPGEALRVEYTWALTSADRASQDVS